ncbi:MAG: hypothetical protein Q8P67_17655 [archaeon]|nr:hypothetical protein [archaeon]
MTTGSRCGDLGEDAKGSAGREDGLAVVGVEVVEEADVVSIKIGNAHEKKKGGGIRKMRRKE